MLESYLKEIASITKRGDATESSYYSALKGFLEQFSETHRKKKVQVTVLPKKTEAGNPDFRVWTGKNSQVGYVEAKSPQANLDDIETTDQLKRYIHTFPNLILTNFYEFRLYRNGEPIASVLVARPFIAAKLKVVPPAEHEREFFALLEKFFQFSLPTKFTAESLAKELATRTRFLRDQVIAEELREASSPGTNRILGFYEAFQKHLISNLKADQFADLYAQTITYGLFAARTRADGEFNRKVAYDLIPKTIGILRDIFHFISFDPPKQLQASVDDITEVLAVVDVKKILHQYFTDGKGSDPVFHFYETFLTEYDPQEREKRGVYYTPEPVVSYIVRSLNIFLKKEFGRKDGFATPSVTVLDPAAGTLTFLAEATKLAVEEFTSKYGKGSQYKFIEDHILHHFYAFELMMAPYAAGHLKMGFLLEELGHKLTGDERFQFYLTNTLDMQELAQTSLPGMASLSEESHLAGKIKKQQPILVILGNPPYSGHSLNKGDWITEQIETYKMVDGKPLGEKNPKWLQDDYVKFIRFAQWKIDQVGEGLLGFITNHSYLDNPTFRGMRQSLMNSFDEIYVLNLHGNSLRKEKAPDGSKDQNVFDIQQGVAIALYVKKKEHRGEKRVFHSELWGLREKKYNSLLRQHVTTTKWKALKPISPMYFFVPREEKELRRFQSFPSVNEIFPVNSVGIVTARDHFVIHFDSKTLERRIRQFRDRSLDDTIIAKTFDLKDSVAWRLKDAREELMQDENWEDCFKEIYYRPFDRRFLFYHPSLIERSRSEVMRHMLKSNICFVTPKRVETDIPWNHILVADSIIEHVAVSLKTIDYCLPLYLYDTNEASAGDGDKPNGRTHQMMMAFEPIAHFQTKSKSKFLKFLSEDKSKVTRHPNVNEQLVQKLQTAYKHKVNPEEVFCYIYAVLYATSYRKKYGEFLKTDFPRVPFTSNYKLFLSLAEQGEKLVELHLLRSEKLDKPIARCEGKGDNKVEKAFYDPKKRCVAFNRSQWFSGVAQEVWSYRIGGYQVAEKWLKDRKDRTLSAEEVSHYCRIITALSETIKIQRKLDAQFKRIEKSVLELKEL